jgi:hypothetical protein
MTATNNPKTYWVIEGRPTKVQDNAGCVCLAMHPPYKAFTATEVQAQGKVACDSVAEAVAD